MPAPQDVHHYGVERRGAGPPSRAEPAGSSSAVAQPGESEVQWQRASAGSSVVHTASDAKGTEVSNDLKRRRPSPEEALTFKADAAIGDGDNVSGADELALDTWRESEVEDEEAESQGRAALTGEIAVTFETDLLWL
jgi:hypothetical protein